MEEERSPLSKVTGGGLVALGGWCALGGVALFQDLDAPYLVLLFGILPVIILAWSVGLVASGVIAFRSSTGLILGLPMALLTLASSWFLRELGAPMRSMNLTVTLSSVVLVMGAAAVVHGAIEKRSA